VEKKVGRRGEGGEDNILERITYNGCNGVGIPAT
jgi:hypothetical protein